MNVAPEFEKYAAEAAVIAGYLQPVFCGKGSFKETYRVSDKRGQSVALKLVDASKCSLVRIEREIEAIGRCNSHRIGRLLESRSIRCSDGREFVLVIEEFFGGGSLEDRLSTAISDSEKIRIAAGLAHAVQELHPLKLVHRDIKPANVMFRRENECDPVLVDFGLVRDLSQASATATWLMQGPGTPYFASPEQLNNDKALIDWRSDQFAVGVIACWMMLGVHPYQADGMKPIDVVAAVAARKGPAKAVSAQLEARGLPGLVRSVSPWPVGRFARPHEFVEIFKI